MFSHIRKFHADELLKSTNKRWLDEAEHGKPLKVWWTKKNDFDEEEYTILYVCLSTNKTFVSELKANEHFKKDKAALKDHNKQLKQLRKDYTVMCKAKAKAQREAVKYESPYQIALKENNPELARAMWKGILHHKKVCEIAMMLCHRRGYHSDTKMYYHPARNEGVIEMNFLQFTEHYNNLIDKIQSLKEQQCLDAKVLLNVWCDTWRLWTATFRDSLFAFSESMLELHPTYNQFVGNDTSYGFATEEMEGVNF